MAVKCKNCGGPHPTWECKKPKAKAVTTPKPAAKPATKKSGVAQRLEQPPYKRQTKGSTPSARTKIKSSTAARKDVPTRKAKPESVVAAGRDVSATGRAAESPKPVRAVRGDASVSGAGTQAPPVDTTLKRGRGRPKSIVDMRAYKAAKQREYRARLKEKQK